jgi:hypothetical protein
MNYNYNILMQIILKSLAEYHQESKCSLVLTSSNRGTFNQYCYYLSADKIDNEKQDRFALDQQISNSTLSTTNDNIENKTNNSNNPLC